MPVSCKKRKLTALLLSCEGFCSNLLVRRLHLHNINCTTEYHKAQLLHQYYDCREFCLVLTIYSLVVNICTNWFNVMKLECCPRRVRISYDLQCISDYFINRMIFVIETGCILCEVGNGFKFHHRTGHEGPEGLMRRRSTLSLT
jgi:hypothetical protein